MPLFSNPQEQGSGGWEPEAAQGRMAKTAGASQSGVFTSDLSVSEYVLLGEAGFEPLGFVVGSSIYHIGLQVGRWSQNQELQVLTQAMYNARELAMDQDAGRGRPAGADGIVGVQLRMQSTPGARTSWSSWPPEPPSAHLDAAGRPPRARRPGVHLRPVGAGLLPAAGGRRGAGRVRARHLRLPHRPPVGDAVAAPGRPEPGDDAVHPGHLRGPGAGSGPDAGRGRRGPRVRASSA